MFVQRLVMLANSVGLNDACENGVSVTPNDPAIGVLWIEVPNARSPGASGKLVDPAIAALELQEVPVNVGPAPVFTSFTTTEFGRTPVNVLLSRSLTTDRELKPLGVTRQEQQAINCSSGEKA